MDSDKLGSVDIVGLHERALDSVAELIQGVSQDWMGSLTPCEGWDVCTLLAHLVGGNRRYEALAEGIPMPKRDQGAGSVPPTSVVDDLLGSDPVAAYCESAEALKGAWRDDVRLEELYDLPFGRLPGRMVLGMHLLETVAHGWDLARATEQQTRFNPEVVRVAWAMARLALSGERSPGIPFASAVDPPEGASEEDRLAAFLGRRP